MTSLKINISPVTGILETSSLDTGKPHLKGSIVYSASGGGEVITW